MSTNLAMALPEHSPNRHSTPQAPRRHIEIVSSRSQRLARPRLVYSVVIVGGLFAVLVSQLLLSIALADGAYRISALQTEQKELVRSQQDVTEALNVLNSPQNLAARAESLGMVSNTSAVYLNLADGSVLGAPSAARASAGSVIGGSGNLLIPNSLLAGVPATMDAAVDAATASKTLGATAGESAGANAGAPEGAAGAGSVASTAGGLPGPVTR